MSDVTGENEIAFKQLANESSPIEKYEDYIVECFMKSRQTFNRDISFMNKDLSIKDKELSF